LEVCRLKLPEVMLPTAALAVITPPADVATSVKDLAPVLIGASTAMLPPVIVVLAAAVAPVPPMVTLPLCPAAPILMVPLPSACNKATLAVLMLRSPTTPSPTPIVCVPSGVRTST